MSFGRGQKMNIKVLLADDHRIVREGLRAMLDSEKDIEIIGESDNGRDTVNLARKLQPDVILMDVSMPDLNGIDATKRIVGMGIKCHIIALSAHADRQLIGGMLRSGASGYLLKECAAVELAQAIRAVMKGTVYVSSNVTSLIVNDYVAHLSGDVKTGDLLSSREREVLQLISEGHSAAHIAELLHVSVKTVESHRKRIMDKLGIRNVASLTKYAIREGITSLHD